jgi:hypothetical protein
MTPTTLAERLSLALLTSTRVVRTVKIRIVGPAINVAVADVHCDPTTGETIIGITLPAGYGQKVDRDTGRELPADVLADAAKLTGWMSDNMTAQSLLYDLDLMPEQLESGSVKWFKMVNILAHMKELERQSTMDEPQATYNHAERRAAAAGYVPDAAALAAKLPEDDEPHTIIGQGDPARHLRT